jgi:AcrR family transcriptional regulator
MARVGRRAEQTAATRRLLIDTARELFAERGYASTSIEQILARTRASRGALYYHFPSKEALFETVFDEVEREIAQRTAPADPGVIAADPLGTIRAGCAAWLTETLDPAIRQISLTDAPAVLGWQRWRQIDEKYGFGAMKAALQLAVDAGQLQPQPVDLLAHMLIAALGEAALVVARSDDPDVALATAQAGFAGLLDGLANRSSQLGNHPDAGRPPAERRPSRSR